jgi:uncharacterized damage-inducible protein DinB
MSMNDALLPEFDQEMANTRKVLERCPEDKFGWKPHPKSFAMGSLVTHMANMTGWAVDTIQKDSFDFPPDFKDEPVKTQAELLQRFDRNVKAARSALAHASDEHMLKPWTLSSGGNVIFTMPRVVIIRSMIMNHLTHNSGQLGVYLRLNDTPVPAIYGPTADEAGA